MAIIGKAKFKNFGAYIAWHKTVTKDHISQLWPDFIYTNQAELSKAYHNIYCGIGSSESWFDDAQERSRSRLSKYAEYLEETDQSWDVRYMDPETKLMVISYGQVGDEAVPGTNSIRRDRYNQFLIENWPEYMEYTPFTDYSTATLAELRQLTLGNADGLTGNTSLIPQGTGADLSIASVQSGLNAQMQALNDLQAKVKSVEEGETEDLLPIKKQMEALKAQMEKMQRRKMADLDALKAELQMKKQEMEKQIFMLESEIYSIRCFLGETVSFVKLRSGKNAPLDQPVVLYQKMRFALEDLGKFSIMWPEERLGDSLEKALARSGKLLDAFAPANKCISLIRYSETGKTIAASKEVKNCLEAYELLHGNQVAILIRNGENLYMGWTDEEKISMRDDFFLKPTKAEVTPLPEREPGEAEWSFKNRMERFEADMERENKRSAREGLSRYFLFAILNGVSAAEDSILPLPKFRNAIERSRHILFSMADGALTDNRFGNFGDIIARCNATIKKGDHIITTLHLSPVRSGNRYSQSWHNDRGRGEKNRTHDVCARDCTIYPINLVQFDKPTKMVRYRVWRKGADGKEGWFIKTGKEYDPYCKRPNDAEILEHFEVIRQHNFISLEKDLPWDRYGDSNAIPARANFEVYTSEFINLTYMNSCWLNYILSTKNVHGWEVKGTAVDYAYALRYIAKALAFIREREKMERENIIKASGEAILCDPDWPAAVSEWKLATGVRELTEYQARRFVKAMIAGEVDTTPKPPKNDSNIELLEEDPWS